VCPQLGELPLGDRDPSSGTGKLLNRCGALIDQAEDEAEGAASTGSVSDALQQIAGEEMLSQGTSSVQVANLQTSNISSRIAALRGGAAGVSLGGVAMSIEGTQVPSQTLMAMLPEWVHGPGGASGDEESPWSRFGIFLNGKWNFGDKDQTDLEAGFDFDTYGLTGGFDYRINDYFVLGLAVGYSTTDIKFANDEGSIDSDGMTYTAYGTAFAGDFYLDFSAGLGNADFDAKRSLVFADARGGVDSEARGKTNGDQTNLSLSGGYNFAPGGWTIGPYVAVDSLKVDIDPFVETEVSSDGSDGWALAYGSQEITSLIATGGLRLTYVVSAKWGVFIPHVRAAFQHEFEDDARIVRARFANDPSGTSFEFLGDAPDSDFYQTAAGFSLVTKRGFSGFLDYEILAGYENLKSDTLTVGIRYDRAFR